jgi:integrase
MRQGELLGLTWSQVDRKRKLILLLDPEKIKNEEPRAVPLSPAALELLDKLPRSTTGKVLPVERLTLYHAFSYACDRAKIRNFTFHDLRHEALSRLAERGDFSVLELAAVSGHKTLQMLKRYTHLQAERLADKLAKKRTKRA